MRSCSTCMCCEFLSVHKLFNLLKQLTSWSGHRIKRWEIHFLCKKMNSFYYLFQGKELFFVVVFFFSYLLASEFEIKRAIYNKVIKYILHRLWFWTWCPWFLIRRCGWFLFRVFTWHGWETCLLLYTLGAKKRYQIVTAVYNQYTFLVQRS